MKSIVVYASKYGSTKQISEFIAEKLRQHGIMAEASSVDTALHPEEYDVIIIGSAVYMGHWMEEAVEFVQRNRDILRDRPVWIFSSGPLELGPGITSVNDPQLEPHEITVLRETIHPREHRIFFGALDPGKLGIKHRTLRKLPAARAILPEGDFRNWDEIESWVISIVRALESLQNTKKME